MPEPTISSEVLDDSGRVLVRTSDGTPFYLPLAVLLGKNGYWLQPNADGSINVIQGADVVSTGPLGSDNAVVSVALAGHSTAGVSIAVGTLTGTVTPVVSFDGGVTWVASKFLTPGTGVEVASVALTSANPLTQYGIRTEGGATHVGVQVHPYSSGTATATVTASFASPRTVTANVALINGAAVGRTNPLPMIGAPAFGAAGLPVAYRASLVAADVLAIPGTVTCTLLTGVGSASAGTYNVKVVAGNAYGRTTAKAGNATVITTGSNLAGRAAFAAVSGATYYDLYFSTDADPKFVGRVTETQRASGIIINGVNTTTAGGTAGAVDIYVAGTGLQAATTAAADTAFSLPDDTGVDASGYQYIDFDLLCSVTGDSASLALVVVPFFKDGTSTWVAGAPLSLTFGGASTVYSAMQQSLRYEARGRKCHLLIASISGTGASVTILSGLS